MIIDHIRNAHLYSFLGRDYIAAFEFLKGYEAGDVEKADIAIDADRIFAKQRPYMTKPALECRYEAHKRYADIHFVAGGSEIIGYSHIERLEVLYYDAEKDMVSLAGNGDFITLEEGYFMICMPEDAHMPCVAVNGPAICNKVIVKVRVDE